MRSIKPVLMLVVDTSGSMERMPVTSALPSCNGNTLNDATQKNRWTGALEAMTGSFSSYACEQQDRSQAPYAASDYDYGYYLPHIAPLPTVQQATDGVIDALQYSVKFGLMTFDPLGTYQDGDPLIAYTSLGEGTTLGNLVGNPVGSDTGNAPGSLYAGDARGMYSYGELKGLLFPGCEERYGMNLGVRGPSPAGGPAHAGALISVGASDDPLTVRANNDLVQSSLLAVRPYGGTPIAATLDDLKYWLQNSDDVRTNGNDAFVECREKYALLLTDGAPDPLYRDSRYMCDSTTAIDRNSDGILDTCPGGTCECPYDKEVDVATKLVTEAGLDKLFVVAFAVDDPTAIGALDAIALAGKTDSAKQVQTAAELRTALNAIFLAVAPRATSRTVPITIDGSVGQYTGLAKSFEIRAGFRPNQVPEDPWDGILERTPITCEGTAVTYASTLNSEDEFHTQLNQQSASNTRKVRTISAAANNMRGTLRTAYSVGLDTSSYSGSTTPDKGPDGNALDATAVPTDTSRTASQGTYFDQSNVVNFSASLSPSMFGDADKDGTLNESDDVQYIANYLDGSSRPGHALSDIYHSQPVAMGPIVTQGVGTRLGAWRQLIKSSYVNSGGTRPQVVFVGTNDGSLHAFNLDTWNGKGPGHEFWSFVPPALYDKLHSAAAPNHVFMFDGEMVVKDMYLGPNSDASLATRSILLAAVRGAPAYVALDVTNPDQEPKVLWQFSDVDMGDTIGKPQLVQVVVEWTNGVIQERAMAILPGGRGVATNSTSCSRLGGKAKAAAPSDARNVGRCWNNRGRVLYVVDVATGKLVQKFDQRQFPAPLTGSIGIDENRPLAQSAYFTDEDGVLWHLALDGAQANRWHVEPIWDVFHGSTYNAGRPSSYAPLVTRDKTGSNVILLGTGDIDSLTDAVPHRVVSLREQRVNTSGYVATSIASVVSGAGTQNWEIVLDPYESVTGPLTLLDGVVYFASFQGTGAGDACDIGSSTLWGVDFIERDAASTAFPLLPVGKLVVEDDPITFGREKPAENNAVVLGLSAGQDPLCLTGETYNNPLAPGGFRATAGPAASTFHIRANTGSRTGSAATPNGSNLQVFNQSVTASFKAQVVGWAGSIE